MEARILRGSLAPPPRWLGVVWAAGVGYVLGVLALSHILGEPSLEPDGFVGLLVLGLAPGLLSALGALLGVQGKNVPIAILLTMIGALIASLLCAPATWLLFVLEQAPPGRSRGDALGMVLAVTVIGGFIAAPLGVLFGALFSLPVGFVAWLRARTSRGSLDAALVGLGVGWVVIGAAAATFVTMSDLGSLFAPHRARLHGEELLWLACSLSAVGLGVALGGGSRWIARLWIAGQIRAGLMPGWALVRASEVSGAGSLPRLFPVGRCDGVLVRRERTSAGPYRSGEPAASVARVAL